MLSVCDNKYCKKCGLHTEAVNPCLMGRGSKESGVLIIGDFNTRFEDKHGNVFLGKHGDFVQKRLDMVGLDCYFTNAIKCPLNTEKKESSSIQRNACRPFTIKLIEEMKPKVIVTLGQVPLNQLIGMNYSTKVLRGRPFYFPEFNAYIVATFQPKGIIYESDSLLFGQFREDLELAKSLLSRPIKRKVTPNLRSLSEPEEIREYLQSLLTVEDIVIDLETTGLDSRLSLITDISLSSKPNEGIHIKWEDLLPHSDLFRQVLESPIGKCFHNAAFDREFLYMNGFTKITNVNFDTMIAFHTNNMSFEGREQQGLYKLKTMAWFQSEHGGYESVLDEEGGIAGVQGIKPKKEIKAPKLPYFWINEEAKTFGEVTSKKAMSDIIKSDASCKEVSQEEYEAFKKEHTPVPVFNRLNLKPQMSLAEYDDLVNKRRMERMEKTGVRGLPYYAAMDALVTREAMNKLKPEIDKQYNNIFYNHIMPLNYVLSRMRINGIRLDREYMEKVKIENDLQAEEVKQTFFKAVGKEINIGSTKDLHELMFGYLKIKPHPDYVSKTTKKPSADAAAIEFYSQKHPELQHILDYRGLMKATSTYIDGFMKEIHPLTGRVHPSYFQNSTATGRLACSGPALQTIPKDNKIRNMVVPSVGCKLVSADLSQAELRVLAELSNDDAMIAAFLSGKDLHAVTACNALLHIPIEQFDKKIEAHSHARTISKTINFGIVYGLSSYTLAVKLNMPMDTEEQRKKSLKEAQTYIDSWFALYNGAKAWLEGIQEYCKQTGYVESMFGRRRYLHDIWSSDQAKSSAAGRQATNMPVQSTASDITCIGLIRMQQFLDDNPKYRSMIVGVIHDDILIDAPDEEIEVISKKLVESMTQNIPGMHIPLVADPSVHDRWTKE